MHYVFKPSYVSAKLMIGRYTKFTNILLQRRMPHSNSLIFYCIFSLYIKSKQIAKVAYQNLFNDCIEFLTFSWFSASKVRKR